jgi:N-acetyl-gamma-glutamyl-phosphate reductase
MKVGVLGASGYAGAELLRLCAEHPALDVVHAGAESLAGEAVGEVYPGLASVYPTTRFEAVDPLALDGLDLLFLALPHGVAGPMAEEVTARVGVVIDLSADFRLTDADVYSRWYHSEHPAPELLGSFAYGLPELFRSSLEGARRVAAPGCYPTAAALALRPLVQAGVIEPTGVVVDAASGVSGAGRRLSADTQFASVNEDFRAYALLGHRHTPEIEQAVGAQVLFTPHLAPMTRGILATCYARPGTEVSTGDLLGVLEGVYADEPFVLVGDSPPSTKATYGSNSAHITARYDERTGWVIVLCAIDNLMKGASGQAVQCANLALGIAETTGLPRAGVTP